MYSMNVEVHESVHINVLKCMNGYICLIPSLGLFKYMHMYIYMYIYVYLHAWAVLKCMNGYMPHSKPGSIHVRAHVHIMYIYVYLVTCMSCIEMHEWTFQDLAYWI